MCDSVRLLFFFFFLVTCVVGLLVVSGGVLLEASASQKRRELRPLAPGAGEIFRGRLTEMYWTTKYELHPNCKQLTRK